MLADLDSRITRLERIYDRTFFEGEVVSAHTVSREYNELTLDGDLGTDYADVEVFLPRLGRTVVVENATLLDSRVTQSVVGITTSRPDYRPRRTDASGIIRGTRVLLICPYGNFRDEVYVLARLGL